MHALDPSLKIQSRMYEGRRYQYYSDIPSKFLSHPAIFPNVIDVTAVGLTEAINCNAGLARAIVVRHYKYLMLKLSI
jgi:hypothetical protein